MDPAHLALVAAAAVAGGFVNAIAGGGSLITFPALVACGVPKLIANVTNSVAMCPGYLGATLAQRRDLLGQKARIARVLPAAALGGAAGAIALLVTGERLFDRIVPFLMLLAAAMLVIQDRVRARLQARGRSEHRNLAMLAVALVAVYGGYFGAGMSVIVLAALGMVLDDTLVRLNALKQAVAFATSIAACATFAFVGKVDWLAALVMGIASLAGGVLGGALATRVSSLLLRWLVVAGAVGVAAIYLAELWV